MEEEADWFVSVDLAKAVAEAEAEIVEPCHYSTDF